MNYLEQNKTDLKEILIHCCGLFTVIFFYYLFYRHGPVLLPFINISIMFSLIISKLMKTLLNIL